MGQTPSNLPPCSQNPTSCPAGYSLTRFQDNDPSDVCYSMICTNPGGLQPFQVQSQNLTLAAEIVGFGGVGASLIFLPGLWKIPGVLACLSVAVVLGIQAGGGL
jgi:hypothetical protein